MGFEDVTDPSNTFATKGLSREDLALIEYLRAAKRASGVDIVCTCTTDHDALTKGGKPSRHVAKGTDGDGLAIDCRRRTPGTARDHHRAVFDAFTHVETQLHELIYAFPPSGTRADGTVGPYNIKQGKRVPPFAVSTHKDHVHVAVAKGVFVAFPDPGTPKEAEMLFPGTQTVPVPGTQPQNGRWPMWGWKPDGSVFCWNFPPDMAQRVPTPEEKVTITADGASVIGLHPRPDGVLGYFLVTDDADDAGGLNTFTFT